MAPLWGSVCMAFYLSSLPSIHDAVVRRGLVDQTADVLRSAHGMGVTVHSVAGKAHSMPQGADEMRELMQFWSQHLSRRPTAAGEARAAAGWWEVSVV